MTKEPRVEQPTKRMAASDTFRILVMDTKEHTDQVKAVCKEAGHAVVAANTIDEAFAFLEGKDHADVIICGAYTEDESLFEFLRRLRLDPIHRNAVFITLALEPGFIGRKANHSTEKAGRLLGVDKFINMPEFDAAKLIAEIRSLLPPVPALEQERQKSTRHR